MRRSDSELLRAFRCAPSGPAFEPLLDRYLPFVYGEAHRISSSDADSAEATRAVFAALARRSRRLLAKTALAGWLFQATRAAASRQKRRRKGSISAGAGAVPELRSAEDLGGLGESATPPLLAELGAWADIGPRLDWALARLPARLRDPVLLSGILNWDRETAAEALRIKPSLFEKRFAKGISQLRRRLCKKKLVMDDATLRTALAANGCAAAVPASLRDEILASAEESFRHRPKLALARSTLRALDWARWRRLLKIATATAGIFVAMIGATVLSGWLLWRSGRLLPWLIEFGARQQLKEIPELAEPARPWHGFDERALAEGRTLRTPEELYRTTNVWPVHLRFSPAQWAGLRPKRVPPVPNLMQPDGTIVLRNPKAQRSGVAGALGFDFEWTSGDLEFSGALFTNVAVRFRGNGTYLGSLYGSKQSFKADLNKQVKGQELAGVRTLNFLNLIEDRSYMHDALGYELFRAAGVPSPRTAYAWLTVSVSGEFERKPLGLYLMVENIDADFAASRFGSKKTPIFKPVTPDLFKYLGEDWSAYAPIYDLKTKATPDQIQRVIDFSKLLTFAEDAEFAQRVGEFLDLDQFGRYLAALVLVANYDSLLTYGQNYYIFLDPEAGKFGFMPWDLDQAWGSFPQFGSASARERASIWEPWAIRNRFLERLMKVDEFRRRYRASLEDLLATAFVPDRLWAKIDEVSPFIRDPIAAESDFRLRLFDQATSTNWLAGPRDGGEGPKRPVHQLKRFIINRADSVRAQLDGRSRGIVLRSTTDWGAN